MQAQTRAWAVMLSVLGALVATGYARAECGDGLCEQLVESCSTCPEDCGDCTCGNGHCDGGPPFYEYCFTCPQDCGPCTPTFYCGDGVCEHEIGYGESCSTCSQDCGTCPVCGNGVCEPTEGCSEFFSCAEDCGCPYCGNDFCDPGETDCFLDCEDPCPGAHHCCVAGVLGPPGGCQDEACCDAVCAINPSCCKAGFYGGWGPSCAALAHDVCSICQPGACGNTVCEPLAGESCASCPTDCGVCCGNGLCDAAVGENCNNCPSECRLCCGNGICEENLGEHCLTCPEDCGGPCCPRAGGECCAADGTPGCDNIDCCIAVCNDDPYCCQHSWDALCQHTASALCITCQPNVCGNGACEPDAGETCLTCEQDCECCGNGLCRLVEDCTNCPLDCGFCCGNGSCEPEFEENCFTCPQDCGGACCGNGNCEEEFDEDCSTCALDCGLCPNECPGQGGDCCAADGTRGCDDIPCCEAVCSFDPYCCTSSWDAICVVDAERLCIICQSDVCGNRRCEPAVGENCATCPQDCAATCGDGMCESACEDCSSCPVDCGPCCGNGVCDVLAESCSNCPADCGCGDGNPCTIDSCSTSGVCVHDPVICSTPPGPCFGVGACDPVTGECTYPHLPIGEGCIPNPPDPCCSLYTCNSNAECVQDCVGPVCDDHNSCTVDSCESGGCMHTVISCDDGIACTVDSCDPATGCKHVRNSVLCSDGLYCNGFEVCDPGAANANTNGCRPAIRLPCQSNQCDEVNDRCRTRPNSMDRMSSHLDTDSDRTPK